MTRFSLEASIANVAGHDGAKNCHPDAGLWILAAGEGGGLRDVTQRYAIRWSSVLACRGSLAPGWDAAVARLAEGREADATVPAGPAGPALLERARAELLDEEALRRRAQREPLPTSRAAFKRHANYVLESQLRAQDVVHPSDAKPVGLFRGQEKVWRRADIEELRSSTQWRREGRLVREGERPLKTLRGGSAFASQLFGRWQTELIPDVPMPQLVEVPGRGPIPGTNNYGNIELLDSAAFASLPPGTVHLPENAARIAASRIGVHFAPVVVGFTREKGQPKPHFGGVVVWARDAEEVRRAAEEERSRREALEERKRQERLDAARRQLVKSAMVDSYVEARHRGSHDGAGPAGPGAESTAKPGEVVLREVLSQG